ncbi:citrate:proton symporter [Corynebacterium sp. ACRQM]|uniref:CitMHS family transporter n=1 Tax=Corynebacterium TaxID=1716 RepID=UPI001EF49552|nr:MULTISPECIES: citrate:proton symporter [Corynebacterium]MCG7242873.1 citrate:proton symporter [Corynebacterium sp. ACRPS]MCG7271429.1 citrate:proton symporter [Corynebacterium sp. ACRQM]MCG7233164.1 citrate:proton symporter [Corynebacterium sp. ACRPR]MDK8474711.1 citrate:proton symporter [Corynebacterium sp. MSK078]MDK8815544.1 citrate:proton symporter [Corynebacterium sp. MSK073]
MQTSLGLTLMGLAIIFVTVGILIRGRVNPIIPMTLVPVIGAVITGFGVEDIADFFGEGLSSVINVVVMFIFAIIFFGILQDVGLFTPVIRSLIKATRGNVMAVTIGTAAIGIVAHLDGSGSTTFLITIPALLPLYRALHMSRYVLITIVALAASVMNMVPWGGPLGRAGAVVEQDPNDIWLHLLPIQGVAVVLIFATATLLGWRENRRLAKLQESGEIKGTISVDVNSLADDFSAKQAEEQQKLGFRYRKSRWVTIANIVIALAVLAALLSGLLPPAPAFLIATTIALVVNFDGAMEQGDALRRHAPNALSMAGVIIAAAMFLGVLNETKMLEEIALSLVNVLPEGVAPYLHLIVGFFGVPLDLLTSTDAYYFSVLPIVQGTVESFGVSGMGAASALIIGNVVGTFVSPFSPALWLALGLADGQMGKYLKIAFPVAWVFSIILVAIAFFTGMLA